MNDYERKRVVEKLGRAWNRGQTTEYEKRREYEIALCRMLDLVEGRVLPGSVL